MFKVVKSFKGLRLCHVTVSVWKNKYVWHILSWIQLFEMDPALKCGLTFVFVITKVNTHILREYISVCSHSMWKIQVDPTFH